MSLRVFLIRVLMTSCLVSCMTGLSANQGNAQGDYVWFVPPQTGEDSDPRDRPKGGGSRTLCRRFESENFPCMQQSMQALVPQSKPTDPAWGLTASATPSLWFFSPYESDAPIPASIELIDSKGQVVWQDTDVQVPSESGIFSYQIPVQANLKSGEIYRWYFSVHVEPEQPAADISLTARLTYQTVPNLSGTENNPLERAKRLAQQGIWYDSVTELAKASTQHWFLWEHFLIKNGFPDLIKQPIHSARNQPVS